MSSLQACWGWREKRVQHLVESGPPSPAGLNTHLGHLPLELLSRGLSISRALWVCPRSEPQSALSLLGLIGQGSWTVKGWILQGNLKKRAALTETRDYGTPYLLERAKEAPKTAQSRNAPGAVFHATSDQAQEIGGFLLGDSSPALVPTLQGHKVKFYATRRRTLLREV